MKFCLILFLLLMKSSSVFGQSEIQDEHCETCIHLEGAFLYQTGNIKQSVRIPPLLLPRRDSDPEVQNLWRLQGNSITDNPLMHGATYLDFAFHGTVIAGLKLNATITAEHRGASYGVYSTDAIVIYPRMNLFIDTSVTLWNERFILHASIGNYDNLRVGNGLMFYNIDVQGSSYSVQWRNIRFEYQKIGDAEFGNGLGINDADHFIFSFRDIEILPDIFLSTHGSMYWYLPGSFRFDDIYGATVGLAIGSQDHRFYSEFGKRYEADGRNFGLLVGGESRWVTNLFSLKGRFEYRSYDAEFNEGYRNDWVYYRDPKKTLYKNMIGPYLYPLRLFHRPFSQWAVFTEYQSHDVGGLTLQLQSTLKLPLDLALKIDLDINRIHASGTSPFWYPFYEVGLAWQPSSNALLMVSATNKAMNLDKHYPTFYLYSSSVVQMSARWNVPLFGQLKENE